MLCTVLGISMNPMLSSDQKPAESTKIFAFVLTYNAGEAIIDCLQSLLWADEVFIVDSGSSDRTVEYARDLGVKVIAHPWLGYGAQLNFALSQATHDWVFFTDQDELVSHELANEIRSMALSLVPDFVYMIERRNLLFNQWLRFGGAVEFNPRLVFRPQVLYCDVQHTYLCKKFTKARVRGAVLHDMAPSLFSWWRRSVALAAIEAKNNYRHGVRFSSIKASFFWWKFVRRYVFKLGFLDGWAGFYMALQRSLYILVYQATLLELERGVAAHAESVERFR